MKAKDAKWFFLSLKTARNYEKNWRQFLSRSAKFLSVGKGKRNDEWGAEGHNLKVTGNEVHWESRSLQLNSNSAFHQFSGWKGHISMHAYIQPRVQSCHVPGDGRSQGVTWFARSNAHAGGKWPRDGPRWPHGQDPEVIAEEVLENGHFSN